MKTKRFLSLSAIFTISFTFFACSGDSPSEPQEGELSSDSNRQGDFSSSGGGASSFTVGQSSSSRTCETNYLGKGYDVIRSSYINKDEVKPNSVLDQDKMCQAGIIKPSISIGNDQNFSISVGKSIAQLYKERNTQLDVKADFFVGGFGTKFATEKATTSNTQVYYAQLRSYNYTKEDRIDTDKQNLSGYLTNEFIYALRNNTPDQIFKDYGTHVFIGYKKGGYMEANYTYYGTSLANESEVKAAIDGHYKVVSASASTSTTMKDINSASNTSFNYKTYGGTLLTATNFESLTNSEYTKWINSIKSGDVAISGIGAFDNNLVPIWELAKAVEPSKATALQSAFNALANSLNIPAGRIFKTADYIHQKDTGTVSIPIKPPTGGTITEIEIYALGAGGGGQGGNYNEGLFLTERGTGGAGGGGSAAYLKLGSLGLTKDGIASFTVRIGAGGKGGKATTTSDTYAGCSGGRGGTTTVVWSAKSITLNAPGGSGGGSASTNCPPNDKTVTGGTGGIKGSVDPTNSTLYISTPYFATGSSGTDGDIDIGTTSKKSTGGKSAEIKNIGTLSSFGGGSGAVREATTGGATITPAKNGGGGYGGHMNINTTETGSGGNGLVTIVYKYYTEE